MTIKKIKEKNRGFLTEFVYRFFLRNKRSTGFTLIETLVAVAILGLAIVGPISIASNGLFTALYAKDQIAAFYLAQDAIEYVRNLRDNNKLNGRTWLWYSAFQNLTDASVCGVACRIDTINGTVTSCISVAACDATKLFYDNSTGFYRYGVGVNSLFSRTITITPVGISNREIRITASVTWKTGFRTKTISFRDNLLNIY